MAIEEKRTRISIFTNLSGASTTVLRELPVEDQKPYIAIGRYNVLISFLNTCMVFIFTNYSYYLRYFFSDLRVTFYMTTAFVLLFALFIFMQRLSAQRLIISIRWQSVLGFCAMAILPAFIMLFLVGFQFNQFLGNEFRFYGTSTLNLRFNFTNFIICVLFLLPFYYINFMIYLRIYHQRYDFYHQLVTDREILKKKELEKKRQSIRDEFRIKNEIKQRSLVYEGLGNVDQENRDEINKIVLGLKSGDIPALLTIAELEMNEKNYEQALEFVNKAIETEQNRYSEKKDYLPDPATFELKAKILNLMSNFEEAKSVSDRFIELSNEKKYQLNLTKEILLERLELENLPFYGSFKWNFQPGINIILGKNGYGKTHLLGLLAALLYDDKTRAREWIPAEKPNARAKLYIKSDHVLNTSVISSLTKEINELSQIQNDSLGTLEKIKRDLGKTKELDDYKNKLGSQLKEIEQSMKDKLEKLDAEQRRICATNETILGNIGRVPLLAIPDSRFIDKSETVIDNSKSASEDLKRDGATEFLYAKSFAGIIKKGLFIVAQNNATDFSKEPYTLIQRVFKRLAGSDNSSGREQGAGTNEPGFFNFVRVEPTSTTGDYKFYVKSEGSKEEFLLQKISQGTFSVLAICLMVYRFLSELRPASRNVLTEKAIVFIDEIDAHLHPSWEQKIVGILRSEFPNVQFIITAHSPLVVAGCYEGEVTVMHQHNEGFNLMQFHENFIGYSTAELLKTAFEIEDRDEQYLKYSAMSGASETINGKLQEYGRRDPKSLDENEKLEIEKLYRDLSYINSVKRIQSKEANTSVRESEIISLKSENAFLREKLKLSDQSVQ